MTTNDLVAGLRQDAIALSAAGFPEPAENARYAADYLLELERTVREAAARIEELEKARARLALAEEVVKAAREVAPTGSSKNDAHIDSWARDARRGVLNARRLRDALAAYDASTEGEK